MRLRNWTKCWIAAWMVAVGCEAHPASAPARGVSVGQPANRKDAVEAKLVGIISDLMKIRPEQIGLRSRFVKDLRFDSLDIVELVIEVEESFDISISDADAEKLQTVGQLVDYIKLQLPKAN